MQADIAQRWEQRLETLASHLLSLEVSTVVKDGVVGQRMPALPLALHDILREYRAFTDPAAPLTEPVLGAVCARLADPGRAKPCQDFLQAWAAGASPPIWPGPGARPPDRPATDLTNGAESFEALAWVAQRLRRRMQAGAAPGPADRRRAALLRRIEENCRQLRDAAIVLEQEFSSVDGAADPARRAALTSVQTDTEPYLERLQARLREPRPAPRPGAKRLFGGTLEQTTQALLRHPRPALAIDPEITLLVRKTWQLGLDEVMLQTVVCIDGDVTLRVAALPEGERAFVADLHRNAVADGIQQWSSLLTALRDVAGLLAGALLGRIGP